MKSRKTGKTPKIRVRKLDDSPYIIDPSKLHRFHSKNIIFERLMWDSSWKGYKQLYDENVLNILAEGKPCYSRVDFALSYASWIVHDARAKFLPSEISTVASCCCLGRHVHFRLARLNPVFNGTRLRFRLFRLT